MLSQMGDALSKPKEQKKNGHLMKVHHTFVADMLPLWLSKVHLLQANVKLNKVSVQKLTQTNTQSDNFNRDACHQNTDEIREPLG